MDRLNPAIHILKSSTNDIKLINKQAACLGRMFYMVYCYNHSSSEDISAMQKRVANELLKAEQLNVPNALIEAVISSNTPKLSECFNEVRA